MDKISLQLDAENFPQLTRRYSEERLINTLVEMCRKSNQEVTEANLYSQAAFLESDLQAMFASPSHE